MSRRQRLHPRIRLGWTLILLLASVVAIGTATFQAQQTVRSHRETAARLLRDYTAIAAWNYQRHASEALREAAVAVLAPVMHFQLHGQLHEGEPPTADWFVDHYIDDSSIHYAARWPIPDLLPSTYFGFTMGGDTAGVRGEPLAPAIASALVDSISTHVRRVHELQWGIGLLTVSAGRHAATFAYTLMPTTMRDTAVYGFLMEGATFAPLFRSVYERAELLPSTLMDGRPNSELVDIAVTDARGGSLFTSYREPGSSSQSEHMLPPQFGNLRIIAGLRSDAAGQLIIGGLPRSRLPLLMALLAIASALALLAIDQLRRESALARLRSDFVSSVSHELRTPLAQLRLFLETLRLGRFTTDKQREWLLDNIDRETARLANLVENLLLFSRLDHGRARTAPEPVALADEIRQIVLSFEPLAASRRARLETEVHADLVATVQREPFRQVLLNLLDNAVKYGPAGQTVTVRLESIAPGTDAARVRITVEDMGPGVPAAERDRIWKPFERGSHAGATGAAGGGIGLSIVQEVVDAHGGKAWVSDAATGGAAFILELPCEQARSPGALEEADAASLPVAATSP